MPQDAHDNLYDSAEQKYLLLNIQRQEHIDAIGQCVKDAVAKQSRIISLIGEEGMGRTYLLHAAQFLLERQNRKLDVIDLDLVGYANEGISLEDYANQRVEKHGDRDEDGLWQRIKGIPIDLKVKASFLSCSIFSIALNAMIPWQIFHMKVSPSPVPFYGS